MNDGMSGGYRIPRRKFLLASAAAGAGLLLNGCRGQEQGSQGGGGGGSGDGAGNFPETPEYSFTFVNHVTTNPFFTATRYGIEDADALLGTNTQWTGSEESQVSQMVDAMNSAISGGADGIAVSVVDPTAFNDPIQRALDQDIPVLAYNANGEGPGTNPALSYIGQDLFQSGVEMGNRIVELVQEGTVALFIATPGQLNIQPRIDGAAQAIRESGAPIEFEEIATGAELPEELNRIDSYYQGHKDINGMFAVDAGSTQGVAQTMEKYGLHEQGVRGGGYDLLPKTLELLDAGHIDFTIDQQPYLQGFYPVIQLFLYKLSNGLTGPSETNTGLLFVEQGDAAQYLETESRFEGDSEQQKILGQSS